MPQKTILHFLGHRLYDIGHYAKGFPIILWLRAPVTQMTQVSNSVAIQVEIQCEI